MPNAHYYITLTVFKMTVEWQSCYHNTRELENLLIICPTWWQLKFDMLLFVALDKLAFAVEIYYKTQNQVTKIWSLIGWEPVN